jgi:hypothetical protein
MILKMPSNTWNALKAEAWQRCLPTETCCQKMQPERKDRNINSFVQKSGLVPTY